MEAVMRKKSEDIIVENVETPVVEETKPTPTTQIEPNKKVTITREDICITSVLLSYFFLFLTKFLYMLGVNSPATYITFFCLGCVLNGLSMFFVFTKFRKEKSIRFTVEFMLNIIALFLWMIRMY